MSTFQLEVASRLGRALPPIVAQRARLWLYPMNAAYADCLDFAKRSLTGSTLNGNTRDYYYWHFSVHGYYDWRNIAIAHALCKEGDTLVEVGANVGTETINYSDIVGRTGKVIAFEPVPDNVLLLKKAIANARYKNVTIHQMAVADTDRQVRFTVSQNQSGMGHIDTKQDGNGETFDVECKKLDSVIKVSEKVRGIIIDAEGADVQIILGARQVIERHRPFIILEVNPKSLRRSGYDVPDVFGALLGYHCFRIKSLRLASVIESSSIPKSENWLCLPQDQSADARLAANALLRVGVLPFGLGMYLI